MRILAVYPYIPYPLDRGAYYRGFHLLREIASAHEVDLIALSEHAEGLEHEGVFRKFCRRVTFIPFRHPDWQKLFPKRLLNPLPSSIAHWYVPEIGSKIRQELHVESYDAIHVFDIILVQYFMGRGQSLPLLVDRTRVDLQYQLMERRCLAAPMRRRLLDWENLAKLWCYERRVARRAQMQVVCGPDDADFLRRYISQSVNLAVIPNGVDTNFFHPEAAGGVSRSPDPMVLFCGALDYNPNVDALRWYFGEMHQEIVRQVPGLTVNLVGKNPTAEVMAYGRFNHVRVTGSVPDVRPYYRRAWLQIVPLRIGGGTRLKIVESMAMGTPVISTTIGAQGLYLNHRHDILLADSAPSFITETVQALKDAGLRHRLEEAARETVSSRLAWSTLGKKMRKIYSERAPGIGLSGKTGLTLDAVQLPTPVLHRRGR